MSEIVVVPGTTTPQLGLIVDSTEPITLRQDTPESSVIATGSNLADTIVAASVAASIAVNIDGEAGDDFLGGAALADTIAGGNGSDQIVGNLGNDRLTGGAGADTIEGNAGADRIDGGVGNDEIEPGAGRDIITTGAGRDIIRIDTIRGGVDRITDFAKQDTIEISQDLVRGSGLQIGKLQATDFQAVQSIRDLDDDEAAKIIYERRTGFVYYNRDNGRDVKLLQLDRNLNISAADFEIF
ncbi:hypothetical protein H6F67_01135 [Microcoleus sp. FACHB-1515]|uniref:calcium-binding protein n=1 Tax=Cyanophyceae TaxID=3028117 RepID=UPI001684A0B8|nr:calcium-binding protein [Microcoleus sp. FACHB-1515]MBD2088472.1 hypothetical protein [Microcoleus sp. FACHB-1515]